MATKPSWRSFREMQTAASDFLSDRSPIITEDRKPLEDVVRFYQPSMKIISNGVGDSCLTMDAADGRRTAKTKGEESD